MLTGIGFAIVVCLVIVFLTSGTSRADPYTPNWDDYDEEI